MTLKRKSTSPAWVETPSGIHQPTNGETANPRAHPIMVTPNKMLQPLLLTLRISCAIGPPGIGVPHPGAWRHHLRFEAKVHSFVHRRIGYDADEVDEVPDITFLPFEVAGEGLHIGALDARVNAVVDIDGPLSAAEDAGCEVIGPNEGAPCIKLEASLAAIVGMAADALHAHDIVEL